MPPNQLSSPPSLEELTAEHRSERAELEALILGNGIRLETTRADLAPVRALRAIAAESGLLEPAATPRLAA